MSAGAAGVPPAARALLSALQDQLCALYRAEAPDLLDFLVDDDGLAAIGAQPTRGADEWVLVAEGEDGLELAIWIAAPLLHQLAEVRSPAQAAAGALRAFCAGVEGLSHALLLIERARRAEPVSLLELEAQAEVDKYVCARLHHPERRAELRRRLFHEADLRVDLDDDERDRYREAGALAEAWCAHLDRLPHDRARIDEQRRFFRAAGSARMHEMRRLRLAA
ncbi:MAG: hypothetical protein JNM72_05510 [Deltaproteobacteria bacterium]|nr:hypothetical protein [Deltaproteobacteria bacterium]